jgi:predicted glycoside hydrolase/deacetylase ChbG (UPF0249 family)
VTKSLALCADDYGWSPAIDRGIVQLAQAWRLTDVSCLVNGPRWPQAARELAALAAVRQGRVRTGLHFNLTEGRPLSPELAALWPQFPQLEALIVDAHLRRLPEAALRAELQAQMQAFEQGRGKAPSHVDGHQHVHHLPQVRETLLALLAPRADIRVRHTGRVRGPGFTVKRLLIEGTGGRTLGRQLVALRRQANTQLYGVYDFVQTDYRRLMQSWLADLPEDGSLVFCHPGDAVTAKEAPDSPADPIATARVRERAYLASDDFKADLDAAGVRLA